MSFKDYAAHGWALCRITPGNKGPVGQAAMGWQKRENALRDPAMAALLPGAGLCHAWSGTCAVDIDNFDVAEKWLAEKGIDLRELLSAKNSVQITSGRLGRYKLLYALPEPLPSKQLAAYKAPGKKDPTKEQTYHGFELRCGNSQGETVQDVLPPTIHPDTGREYAWTYGDDLVGDWRNLPPIPEALLALWQAELRAAPNVGPVEASGADHAELSKLLATLDPDGPYEEWIKTGAALHHETRGQNYGFVLWDTWSARGSKYKGTDDLVAHWRSFRHDSPNAVTLGSLRREAVAATADFPLQEPSKEEAPPPVGWNLVQAILEPRLVFVSGQDQYFDVKANGEPWLSDRSVRHMFCPHMPIVQDGVDKKGSPKMIRPDPVTYMQMSKTKKVVDAVGINPGAEAFYREDGMRFVNRYKPSVVEPLLPKPFEEEQFLFLWSRMKDHSFQRWIMRFFAHALQKPGVKIQTAPLLYSAETGTGKNTICHTIPQLLFGAPWVRTISGNVLASQFNDTVGSTWWLYLEELRSGVTKPERIALTNKIKSWVTDNMIEVHPKGMKPYNVRNRIQLTASSNFEDALQLDNNDRRWAICEMDKPLTESQSRDLFHFLSSDRAPGVLRHIFSRVDLTGFSPTARAPNTAAKVAMIRAGVGVWESMIIEQMIAGRAPFDRDIFRLQDVHESMIGKGPVSQHALRHVLTKHPFNCEQLPHGRELRLYAWRNLELWKKQPEGARMRYMETGERPIGVPWSDDMPPQLEAMSADGPREKVVCDLI